MKFCRLELLAFLSFSHFRSCRQTLDCLHSYDFDWLTTGGFFCDSCFARSICDVQRLWPSKAEGEDDARARHYLVMSSFAFLFYSFFAYLDFTQRRAGLDCPQRSTLFCHSCDLNLALWILSLFLGMHTNKTNANICPVI